MNGKEARSMAQSVKAFGTKPEERGQEQVCYMVDGPAEPKGVNGRWEMMKEIWLKATEDVLT